MAKEKVVLLLDRLVVFPWLKFNEGIKFSFGLFDHFVDENNHGYEK